MTVEIKEVSNKREFKKFIGFPYKLFKGNKYWCPPMRFDEANTLNKKKNPAFEYCESQYLLAYKEGKLVGRLAGIISHKSNEKWNNKYARFGWTDFIDDYEVSNALFTTFQNWAVFKGMTGLHGPMGFTDMDNEGLLVKGFDEKATMASIYNHPYYLDHIEKFGFVKDVDWVQYEFTIPEKPIEKFVLYSELIQKKYNLRILKVKNAKELLPYGKKMFITLNAAFKDLYGFVELNDKQIENYTKQYFGFIRPEFVCFVLDANDDVVGFGISMPSLTEAMQRCNGKLFPFGWFYVLRALKKNDLIDMYLNGVRPDYQGKAVHTIYYCEMMTQYINHKTKFAISSNQLEENAKALNVWKYFNGRQHMTRRCYVKHLQ